ncbi:putative inactive purple acid phosphatase 28-like [Capsicum annuum]|uniref:putative F-box protein At4g38870 n=1 Tax=Capsicum annuum TaxID=4072 RepID=UPI001FB12FAD|nr:putative F-box protein At4g38870 [Capsicum annuum]KAF3656553.1 putative inactive purple acid phosphatase 28-like [Capsicum annuum]KAF3664498.1 putative inactive purple acid phosphatase 28-like [Capsicum annuum]
MDNTMELRSNIMALPCEVLVDIFTRLSLKHVHQLQIVSKLWHRTISSPHFRRLYNMKSMNRPRSRLVKVSNFKYSDSWEMISRTITISTMDLAVDNNEIQEEFSFEDIIAPEHSFITSSNLIIFNHKVCNPTTKEIIDIPISSYPSVSFDVAYVPSNNTYKIVHLYGTKIGPDYNFNYGGSPVEFRFETLTLRDGGPIPNSWRALTHQEWFSYKADSTCVNGVIHWLVGIGGMMEKRVISMEIESEEFLSSIGCPNNPYIGEISIFENIHLADLNGKLCLSYYSEESSRMDLYFVKDWTNEEWVKEHTINLSGGGVWCKIMGYVQVQGNNGEIIIDSKLYNIKENRFRTLPRPKMTMHSGLYFDRCFKLESTKPSVQPSVDLLSN